MIKINSNNKQNYKHKQHGFTIIELMIGLAIISSLTILIYYAGSTLRAKSDHSKVKTELTSYFPTAVRGCLDLVNNNLTTCTSARIRTVSVSPLRSTLTPCGDTWTMGTANAANITVTYPLDSCIDADVFGAALATELTALTKISAVYNAATDDIVVIYSR